MIIHRPVETKRIKEFKKWVFVFGRRKTGKTFLIKNFIDYDDYFFVKRDKTILAKEGKINYEAFLNILKRSLEENKKIVIDEFHRLGDDFFDFLHFIGTGGRLIVLSSTLFLSKKLLAAKSPILGLFAEVPVGLIKIIDCLKELRRKINIKKNLVEAAIFAREPLIAREFNDEEPRVFLRKILISSINIVPSLIGEIFIEEERSLSAIYEGILRAIADGKVISTEISSYLFSAKLIEKDNPGLIQQHLNNLIKFGIIKRIIVYNKNKFVYKHVSPLARLFYYADEKYNISERVLTETESDRIINEIMPKIVEENIREFLTEKYGLIETVVEGKDHDVDALLLKFKKPELAVEIKWKDKIDLHDLIKTEKNLETISAKRKLLFVPDKKKIKLKQRFNFEIVDISDFK